MKWDEWGGKEGERERESEASSSSDESLLISSCSNSIQRADKNSQPCYFHCFSAPQFEASMLVSCSNSPKLQVLSDWVRALLIARLTWNSLLSFSLSLPPLSQYSLPSFHSALVEKKEMQIHFTNFCLVIVFQDKSQCEVSVHWLLLFWLVPLSIHFLPCNCNESVHLKTVRQRVIQSRGWLNFWTMNHSPFLSVLFPCPHSSPYASCDITCPVTCRDLGWHDGLLVME